MGALIRFVSNFVVNHVYTAAQGSYTNNVMQRLDPDDELFRTVTHRDIVPHHNFHGTTTAGFVGKDLGVVPGLLEADRLPRRAILIDDRVYNFDPQPDNGVHVQGYFEVGSDGYFF